MGDGLRRTDSRGRGPHRCSRAPSRPRGSRPRLDPGVGVGTRDRRDDLVTVKAAAPFTGGEPIPQPPPSWALVPTVTVVAKNCIAVPGHAPLTAAAAREFARRLLEAANRGEI